MHTLIRKMNAKNIVLDEDSADGGESVGIATKDDKPHFARWLGFLSRADSKRSGGRSVKLEISRVDGVDLEPGEYVQGCLVDAGVYAVFDTIVAIKRHGVIDR